MSVRYIGAILIGMLFSSFYQIPVLADDSSLDRDTEVTTLQNENKTTKKQNPFITKKKVQTALLVLVATGVISWGVYKTLIQKPKNVSSSKVTLVALDPVILQSNAKTKHNITVNFVIGDITQQDFAHPNEAAIVNAANERMLGGGGIDGAIHKAAGPKLREECEKVPQVRPGVRCPTGEARITGGHNLPVKIIHTVGPDVRGKASPDAHDAQLLENVYTNILQVTTDNDLREIAIPSISTGIFAYPLDEAANIAANTVREFVDNNPTELEEIRFVLSNQATAQTYRDAFAR